MSTARDTDACPNCAGKDLYVTCNPLGSGGGYAPNYLPGLGPWYRSARLRVVLCGSCGLMQWFADPDALAALPTSPKWRRL